MAQVTLARWPRRWVDLSITDWASGDFEGGEKVARRLDSLQAVQLGLHRVSVGLQLREAVFESGQFISRVLTVHGELDAAFRQGCIGKLGLLFGLSRQHLSKDSLPALPKFLNLLT